MMTPSIQDEARDRLRNLSIHLPGADEAVYVFGKYLADRLGHGAFAERDFVLSFNTACAAMWRGEVIDGMLFPHPQDSARWVGRMIVPIVEAVFPEEFAKGVLRLILR